MSTGFAASRDRFEALPGFLDGTGAAALPHAQPEERLDTQGRALINQLLQDHLDLRAAREQPAPGPVTGADTVARTRVETGHQRGLATVFGQVTVTRIGYRAPGAGNLYPADAALNLGPRTQVDRDLEERVVGFGEPAQLGIALDRQRRMPRSHPRAAVQPPHQRMRLRVGYAQPGEERASWRRR